MSGDELVVLGGHLLPALGHGFLQAARSLEGLVALYKGLLLAFAGLQVEGPLALLHSCSLLALRR